MHNNLVPNTVSESRQWPLIPILLPDIVFLEHRGISKLLLCKMHISFFHSAFGSVLEFHNISLLPDPISESEDQFRIMSSEMKLYGWDEYPGTRGSGRVDQVPGYKYIIRYPNANYRMYK